MDPLKEEPLRSLEGQSQQQQPWTPDVPKPGEPSTLGMKRDSELGESDPERIPTDVKGKEPAHSTQSEETARPIGQWTSYQAQPTNPPAPQSRPLDADAFMFTMQQMAAAIQNGISQAIRDSRSPSQAPASTVGTTEWKLQDVGLFWPDADTATYGEDSLFYQGKQACYRDVTLFIQSICQASQILARRDVIRTDLYRLLRGSALAWYQQQLTDTERLHLNEVDRWIPRLQERFGIKIGDAITWLSTAEYSKEDNVQD